MTTRDEPVTFKVKVNLVLVPVVVRDAKGNAVGTLRQEDFQLFDRGKPQTIKHFSLETAETRAAKAQAVSPESAGDKTAGKEAPAVPQRFVAYVFDDLHLNFGEISQSRTAADRQLSALRPTDRAALYTTSGRNMVEFTDDAAKLHEALFRIMPQSELTGAMQCPNWGYYLADLIEKEVGDIDHPTPAVQEGIDQAKRCPEFTPPNPMRPGQPPPNTLRIGQLHMIAERIISLNEVETRSALDLVKDVVRRISALPGERTIVIASPGFLTPNREQELTEIVDRAARSNVVINTIDARGVYNVGFDASDNSGRPPSPTKMMFDRAGASAQAAVLEEWADGTGGRFFHDNDLDGNFRRAAAVAEYRYILGFSPQNLKMDSGFHKLKVVVKSPHLSVQARHGYFAPNAVADPAEAARQEVEAAMFSQDEIHDIPIDLRMQFFKTSDMDAKLSVVVRMDLRKLPLRRADERNCDNLAVFAAAFDSNGNYVTGKGQTIELRLRDDTLARLASGISIKNELDVKTGNYLVRVVVRDAEGQLMAAENKAVQIP